MSTHGTQPGPPHDERDAFFRDLRALRERHGLDLREIAERTRFPEDALAAAEIGPELPELPALSAYLRGCGEPLTSWEDRWRRLASETAPADDDLPVRDAGTSPLASAGAAAAAADVPVQPPGPGSPGVPARPAYTIKRLGHRRPRQPAAFSRRYTTVAAGTAVALLAAGGVALLAASRAPVHRAPAAAPPSPARTASPPAQRVPSAGAAAPRKHPHAPGTSCLKTCLEVVGVGCPQQQGDGVVLGNAPTGPGWTTAGGGWTGNGCDGSAVWTLDPNGNQLVPSALAWKFSPAAGISYCTLAVFVPTQNALGTGNYAIFTDDPAESRNIATVLVSQAARAGQWITLGSYPVSGNFLEIQVAPATGTADTPGSGAHGRNHVVVAPGYHAAIAASAASARCS